MAPPPNSDNDAGLVARERQGDNAQPLTISEISALLKRTVEDRFGFVRLRGELSRVTIAASGHMYCSLKDEGAKIDAVMWKGGVQRLGFRPEEGLEVIATGKHQGLIQIALVAHHPYGILRRSGHGLLQLCALSG